MTPRNIGLITAGVVFLVVGVVVIAVVVVKKRKTSPQRIAGQGHPMGEIPARQLPTPARRTLPPRPPPKIGTYVDITTTDRIAIGRAVNSRGHTPTYISLSSDHETNITTASSPIESSGGTRAQGHEVGPMPCRHTSATSITVAYEGPYVTGQYVLNPYVARDSRNQTSIQSVATIDEE